MLTKEQKKKLRKIEFSKTHSQDKPGNPVAIRDLFWINKDVITREEAEVSLPDYQELFNLMVENLKDAGVKELKRVSPAKANLIIRTYQRKNYEYDCRYYFIVGACCYTKSGMDFYSYSSGYNFRFDVSKHDLKVWICQDDSFEVDCDFVDFYCKVSM